MRLKLVVLIFLSWSSCSAVELLWMPSGLASVWELAAGIPYVSHEVKSLVSSSEENDPSEMEHATGRCPHRQERTGFSLWELEVEIVGAKGLPSLAGQTGWSWDAVDAYVKYTVHGPDDSVAGLTPMIENKLDPYWNHSCWFQFSQNPAKHSKHTTIDVSVHDQNDRDLLGYNRVDVIVGSVSFTVDPDLEGRKSITRELKCEPEIDGCTYATTVTISLYLKSDDVAATRQGSQIWTYVIVIAIVVLLGCAFFQRAMISEMICKKQGPRVSQCEDPQDQHVGQFPAFQPAPSSGQEYGIELSSRDPPPHWSGCYQADPGYPQPQSAAGGPQAASHQQAGDYSQGGYQQDMGGGYPQDMGGGGFQQGMSGGGGGGGYQQNPAGVGETISPHW